MSEEIQEEWRDVVGYEGLYQVSNTGKVKNIKRNKELKPSSPIGYKQVNLMKNGIRQTFHIHRLVALAFIPNPENKPCIDHLDGTRSNDNVFNLRWVTYSENNKNEITFKRNIKRVREVCCNPELELQNISESLQKSRLSFKNAWEKSKRKVINIETQKIWDSCTELSKFLGVSTSMISAYCSGKKKCRKIIYFDNGVVIKNPIFRYVEESLIKRNPRRNCSNPLKKKVKCLENNFIWDSISNASKILNIAESCISAYCKGIHHCKKTIIFEDGTVIANPHFEFVDKEKENINV